MRNRSWRRHQRSRMKKKARRFAWINEKDSWNSGRADYPSRSKSERRYEQNCDNLCVCSCPMCGNPRKSGWLQKENKLSVPERKALERDKSQIKEFLMSKKTEAELLKEIFGLDKEPFLSFYYEEEWESKTGEKYKTMYCGLCECYSIICPHCRNISCNGSGCEKCDDDFEEFNESGLCENLREKKEIEK